MSTLNLHNNATDAGFMNEVPTFRLFRDAGVPAPRTTFARVFVTVPRKHERRYFGLYTILENVDNNFGLG
ncbi:MAG: CotH kinase family protein [Verrucomicrobia bacterium]|nr:CotH kinase family protein [Verrucomicrobiota bacterium]